MSDPITRPNAAQVSFVVLFLLIVIVVLIRSPLRSPWAHECCRGGGDRSSAGVGGMGSDTAQQARGGTVAQSPSETNEPPLRTGCFRSGSSRDEVRAVMGAPDAVDRGAWEYGQSWVTFGYGVVLDFRTRTAA